MTRPIITDSQIWATGSGRTTTPSTGEFTTGHQGYPNQTNAKIQNYLDGRQDLTLQYLLREGVAEWDSAETYGIGNLAKRVISGEPFLYYNKTGTNTATSPESDNTNWEIWRSSPNATKTERGITYIVNKLIELSNNSIDSDHDIDFTSQPFNFSDGTGQGISNAYTKRINANWTIGNNLGGMTSKVKETGTYSTTGVTVTGSLTSFDTEFSVGDILWSKTESEGRVIISIASATSMTIQSAFGNDVIAGEIVKKNGLAPDATYHSFVLSNADGSVTDYGFDTNVDAINILADNDVVAEGLTKYKRVGSILTDGNANIIQFFQYGNRFMYKDFMYNSGTIVTTETLQNIDVPTGIKVLAHISVKVIGTTGNRYYRIYSPDTNNSTPSSTNWNMWSVIDNGAYALTNQFEILTNTSGQIATRASISDSAEFITTGFIDTNL